MTPRTVSFTVAYRVLPKQGDRSRIAKMRDGRQFVAHHPNKKVKRNADELAYLIAQYRPSTPLVGALELEAVFTEAWPASLPAKHRYLGGVAKDTRPDWDNLSKNLCDVLQASGFYLNDGQIASAKIRCRWDEYPSLWVSIRELGFIKGRSVAGSEE